MPIEDCEERVDPYEKMWCFLEEAKNNLYQAQCFAKTKARQAAINTLITEVNKTINRFF